MAVTIVRQPEVYSWSKNPMLYEFESDLDGDMPGTGETYLCRLYINLDPEPTEGQGFILSYFGHEDFFYFNDVPPPGNPNALPTRQGGNMRSWFGYLEDRFRAHPRLSNFYNITLVYYFQGGSFVRYFEFESKAKTDKAEMTKEGSTVSLTVIRDGRFPDVRRNVRVYAELWIKPDADFIKIMSAAMPTDQSGRAQWDISNPLSSAILAKDDLRPALQSAGHSIKPGAMPYYFVYTDMFGVAQLPGAYLTAETKYAVYGGLPKSKLHLSLLEVLKSGDVMQWLSPLPDTCRILPDQEVWLYWVNVLQDLTDVEVRVTVTYTDGSVTMYTHNTVDIAMRERLELPVSMSALDIASKYPELTVDRYEVYIWHDGKVISPRKCYVLDNRYLPYARAFIYLNSWGGYDSIYTYGRKESSYDISKEQIRTTQARDFNLLNGTESQINLQTRNREVINTGYRSKEEIVAMRDFFLSRDKYMLVDGKWWPISVVTDKIRESTDGNNLYALEFEVVLQHMEEMWWQ